MTARRRRAVSSWSVWAPAPGSGTTMSTTPSAACSARGHSHRERRGRRLIGRPPQDRGAALGADHRVHRVLEGHHDVAHGDRERAARAALPGDDGDDRRPEAAHQPDRSRDRLGDAALLRLGPGMGAGHVDEGDDRQPEALRELHHPHGLAIALGVRHAEVAPDVLLGVGALLLADDDDPTAADPGEAGHDRRIVAEQAVAVELDELVGHRRHELEGARPLEVAGELDARPDRRLGSSVGGRRLRRSASAAGAPRTHAGQPRGASGVGASAGDGGWTPAGRMAHCQPTRRPAPMAAPSAMSGTSRVGSRSAEAVALGRLATAHEVASSARSRRASPSRWTTRSTKPCSNRNSARWKPGRQLLGDRARGDARAGEPDERVRLGDVDVAEHGERGEDAAGRGIRQHADVRHAGRAHALQRRDGLGELHQRSVPSCIRAPPDAETTISGTRSARACLGSAGDLLADDRAHRAAHEREVHDADRDLRVRDAPGPPDRGIAHPGRGCAAATPIGVRLLVDEPERIDRFSPASRSAKEPRIDDPFERAPGPTAGSGGRSVGRRAGPCRAAC